MICGVRSLAAPPIGVPVSIRELDGFGAAPIFDLGSIRPFALRQLAVRIRSASSFRVPYAVDVHCSVSSRLRFCILERVKHLAIPHLVAKLAVKRLVVAVLRGAPGLNVERLDADPPEPVPNGMSGELAAVVGVGMFRWPTLDKQFRQGTFSLV